MENTLTIYVIFEGLGFCCFNPKRGGAEIAFLRLPEHDLKIKITGDDGRHKVFNNIADNAKIELTSEGAPIEGFRLNNSGKFSRKKGVNSENDLFDLRWLLDLEGDELHGKKATRRKKPKLQPHEQTERSVRSLTRMFLPNAYFFNEQILSREYHIEQINTVTSNVQKKEFGLIGAALGAKIDAVKASLRIDEKNIFQFDEGVDPKEVTRFFVTITNVCDEPLPEPQSDFRKYYEVLDFRDDKEFDFNLPVLTKGRRPAICEIALLSKTESLDGFFDD
jgi:hypothetical protein